MPQGGADIPDLERIAQVFTFDHASPFPALQ
jgi:hypothetical protein